MWEIALASAGMNLLGGLLGSNAAQQQAQQQADIANANLANSLNQQRYQQGLNAVAMQRSIAGMTDAQGNRSVYDPATNQWQTDLSARGAAIQNASDGAGIARNTTDQTMARDANTQAISQGLSSGREAESALAQLRNFRPMQSRELEGRLQETSTIANTNAQRPIIADMLRAFARQGTSAGPVLTDMMRDNASSLRAGMLNNQIAALEKTSSINNNNVAGLIGKYSALRSGANPQLQFAPIQTSDPSTNIASLIASRANNAPMSASSAGHSVASMTNAVNQSAGQAISNVPGNPFGAQLMAGGSFLNNVGSNPPAWLQTLFGNSGSSGDQPLSSTMPKNFFG